MLLAGNLDEDGRNYRPKHVELSEIINKLLLLHLVGCLYYCIMMHSHTNIQFLGLFVLNSSLLAEHSIACLLLDPAGTSLII